MQRNSNQQPFSVSIRAKREQLRNQIRRQQLQEYFRQKRIEFFNTPRPQNSIDAYMELVQRIKKCTMEREELQEIEAEVRQLFDSKPEEELNFYALGQLIAKLREGFFDYRNFILREENLAFHSSGCFAWCFGLYFGRLNFEVGSRNLQQSFVQELEEMDRFLAAVLERFFANFKLTAQNLYCFELYAVCFVNILYLMEKEEFFPINMFNVTVPRLESFYKAITDQKSMTTRELKLRVTELINEIVRAVDGNKIRLQEQAHTQEYEPVDLRPEYFVKNRETECLMRAAAEIFEENIKDASEQRAECLRSIFLLSKFNAINAGEYLFTEKNIRELIFQMINQRGNISLNILDSLMFVFPGLTNRKVTVMLNDSLHINLVLLLRDSLQDLNMQKEEDIKYSDSVFKVLRLIEILLERVEQMDGPTFREVFRQMDGNGLGDLLEGMNSFRYDQKIEDIWARIIEGFYSEEMEEENAGRDENAGDYANYQQQNDYQKSDPEYDI